MIEISIGNLEKRFGDLAILDGLSFDVQRGDRAGIIGRNGCGKTTLFRIIAGIEDYNKGSVSVRNNSTIGYLQQIPQFDDSTSVLDVLNFAFVSVNKMQLEIEKIEHKMRNMTEENSTKLMKNYHRLQTEFELRDGYNIEVKLNKVCTGLKINSAMQTRKFKSLSGGEKTTVMLGQLLLKNPEILLLDEPTNHLDIESVEWLEHFLAEYSGTVVLVSHDRYFLDKLVNKIIEIEDGKATTHSGNYTSYKVDKEKKIELQFKAFKNQQKKIKAMQEAIKRFRDWGGRADNPAMFKKAFNLEKRLEKMEKLEKPTESGSINLRFTTEHRSGKDVLRISELKKSFDDQLILDDLEFNLFYKERVCIIGKNGSGKSTIFKLILDELEADSGEVKIGSRVKIGYLQQEVEFTDEDISLIDFYRTEFPLSETQARTQLAGFLFFGNEVYKRISILSGGEKVRLKLCVMMHKNINLLLLDEPTNHLDLESIEAMEESLHNFKGTILFISHDRYFINKMANKIVAISEKKLKSYSGNYNFYKRKKTEEQQFEEKDIFVEIEQSQKIEKKKEYQDRKKEANRRKNLKRRLANIEHEIKLLENDIQSKQDEMSEFGSDYKKLCEIQETIDLDMKKISLLFSEWEKSDNEKK
ncbi:MAG: ABC-F type ribosomal protection protein [Candidatus Cloacimonadota bacterium]|nr:ABC-F type ribosomal protection protein [Candidatus Cloacimonadota bacterium]